jgi:hypothetical protein
MGTESIASEKANNQDRVSVPSILDEFLELQAANAFYHKKRPPQSHTGQRSTKTRAKGSTGNQVLTAIQRDRQAYQIKRALPLLPRETP